MHRSLHLALFPLAELATLGSALALVPAHPLSAAALGLVAALALDFSVHIALHELVHVSGEADDPWRRALGWGATLLAGLPFDGYRWHHYNHHRFANAPGDFSSTLGRRALEYALRWPSQTIAARADFQARLLAGEAPRWIADRITAQKRLLALLLVALALFSWKALALYVAVIYVGWALVSVHNYGQHPPDARDGAATSFAHPLYNRIFCNNGIHFEHHDRPGAPWHALVAEPTAPEPVEWPHLLLPAARALAGRSRVAEAG